MILSDISVTRPVLATVLSLLLVAFGLVAFDRLPLREYPDIDPPVVSIETVYPGAAANVVETRITQLIEDRIAGVEGIRTVESSSQDGRSEITVQFDIDRDIDGAANDIRDRVSGILDQLPVEAEPPDIQKVDSNEDVIMWLNLVSDRMTVPELTDYARRYLVDRFSVLDGVARVRVGGNQTYAMRVWIDRSALAARGLTVADVEAALRAENLELPAGSVESIDRQFTVRLERSFRDAEDFGQLVLAQGADGYLVRLGDVARVERGTEEDRTFFRGNGVPMVGIGIIKQSTANTIAVADAAKAEMARINPSLPEGMEIKQSYDTSVFVKDAIKEVYKTLGIAIGLVVLVIFLFLGRVRAMLVPAVTVPVSLVATFTVLYALGFSINILTLLALVLAIGLVVDDAIVVLENIHRRMEQYGETRLVAAFRGTRQVGFAVVATTVVLVAVFVPIAFLQGDVGRLFSEFALTMAAAVIFSTFVALSLSPMLASQILPQAHGNGRRFSLSAGVDWAFERVRRGYGAILRLLLRQKWLVRDRLRRDHRRCLLAVPAGPAGICAEGGSRRLLRAGQRPGRRLLWLHGRVHGRDRAPAAALCRVRRGHPRAGAHAARLRRRRRVQHRHRHHGAERLRRQALRLGHHGRDPRQARRPARRQGLPGHAPGLRRAHREAGAVRHRRRQLRGAGRLARHAGQGHRGRQPRPDRPGLGLQGDQAAAAGGDRLRPRGRSRRHGRQRRAHAGDHARLAQGHDLHRETARNTTSSWRASATPSAPPAAWPTSTCAPSAAAS